MAGRGIPLAHSLFRCNWPTIRVPRKEGMEAAAATAAPAEARDVRALAGDRDAFNGLYVPHFEGVYDYVLRIVREREQAAGVVRETFARAWRAFPEQGNEVAA